MDTLKQLHTSVAQLFEDSFDHAYKNLNAELARRDAQADEAAKAAKGAHGNATTRIQELEREVANLKKEIHPCEVDAKSKRFSASMQEAYGPERVLEHSALMDLHPDMKERIANISTKYRSLYENFQELVCVCGTLRAKVDSHKRKLVQWQDRVTREEFTIELSGVPVKFRRMYGNAAIENILHFEPSRSRQSALEPLGPVSHKDKTGTSTPTLNQQSIENHPEQSAQTRNGTRGALNPSFTFELPCSASLRPDLSSASQETVSNDLSSDESTGTVTRELKRKRVPLPGTAHQNTSIQNGITVRSQQAIIIKSESMSSSPSRNFSEYRAPAGTQDLDEVGSSVETPTKKKRRNCSSSKRESLATDVLKTTRELGQDHENSHQPGSERRRLNRGVLQPVDGNSRATGSSEQQSSTTKLKGNTEKAIRNGIPSLTEDGESYVNAKRTGKHTSSIETDQYLNTGIMPAQQRLQSFLEGPAPSRSPLNVPWSHVCPADSRRPVNKNLGSNIQHASAEGPRPSEAKAEGSMRTGMVHGRDSRSVNAHEKPSDAHHGDESYRTLPLHRLELNHFKINSDYNHGADYAFGDIVRKGDERKGLSGCTHTGCCGDKFLAIARAGGLQTNLGGVISKEADEEKIIEEYLGDEKDLIHSMDPQDRQELLHEARAKHISDIFGKHKHVHQRPRTPPGFWRTDMPDTQELEHDREEAEKVEREKVYERYREAMRPGGLWKFADE
ncbi:SAE2 C-terminal domain-containing protein [Aspergillus ruber CBS 135680]|uniref:SAE2-domain-containing protein n=1 Tax=Aspergillus ruber (strain CBS 135680) TaxID=1388766 RepID=A0A017SRH4_ASPRC|nr:SAE2-domain-containing protein [Aspergillus ruber CBS 135680]EYE99557.1 SAE2-domain-containing protein [Aspergillus ruber CBS 135680]